MKRFKLKLLSPLGLAALMIFAMGTQPVSAATTTANLNVTGVPTQGTGTFSSNGSCPTSGNISFSLINSNGTTTNLGTVANTNSYVSSNGQYAFSAPGLAIPQSFATGPATLVATCPNGDMLTSAIVVSDPANTVLLNFNNPNPTMIGNVTANGICGPSNASGNPIVNFDLSQNGNVFIPISTTTPSIATTATGANGQFTAVLSIPTNFSSGLATLRATCSNGATLSNLVVLGSPTSVTLPSSSSVTPANNNNSPAVAGVSITPTGGVNAGAEPATASTSDFVVFAAILATIGTVGFILKRKLA